MLQQLAGVGRLVQPRRDGEQMFERVAVRLRARGLLCRLHRERGVLGDGDEHVDLVAARLAPGDRLVDGEDAEQLAVRAAHRREQRVVRMPRVRVVADRQVGGVNVEPSSSLQSNSPAGTKYAPRWRKRWSSSGSQSETWRTWPSSASRATSLP